MHKLPDSGFDRVTFFYDSLAKLVFGNAQQQAQQVLLPFIKENDSVLIIGGGSGWLLEQLLLKHQNLHILYLDASPNMVRLAQKKTRMVLQNSQIKVEFRVGTEQALLSSEQFDIVFTPFLLDLFPAERLKSLMRRLAASLKPDGIWLFADFWPVTQPAPVWQRVLLKTMYLFFGVTSGVNAKELPDFAKQFEQLHFQEVYSNSFYKGMIQGKAFRRRHL